MNGEKLRKVERPTLAEVALQAGVAASTASAVLNGAENCWASERTRERVFDSAAKLGYRPNLAARSLRMTSTKTIGLITNGFGSPAKEWRLEGFCEAASQSGYDVMITYSANDASKEDHLILRHLDRQVDGIAIYPTESGEHLELRKLCEMDFPVVLFDSKTGNVEFDCEWVGPDYENVGMLQAEHLFNCGAERICIAKTSPEAMINTVRENGIIRVLRENGKPSPIILEIKGKGEFNGPSFDVYRQHIMTFIKKHHGDFDAVVAHDTLASIMIRVLTSLEIKVPDDVQVMGAGNSMLASHGPFGVSSIDTDDKWIGAKAFKILHDNISASSGKRKIRGTYSVNRVIKRDSTKRERQ